jgi:uncharacterized protein YydD (DUF2326 family)
MFLKSLTIFDGNKIIRKINFKKGLNLIVDETLGDSDKATGNNVGKTTVLKLVDFCLGGNQKLIYVDPETKREEYTLVKNFLIEHNVVIKLILKDNLEDENSTEILIERNFLPRSKKIRKINGKDYTEEEFELELTKLIFPEHTAEKPTFRQIISHNIRYKEESINYTLKNLDKYTSDVEYETLMLFLLGCEFKGGNLKQDILTKLKQEEVYKNRVSKNQTKTTYETTLSLLNGEIEDLNKRKSNLNLNEHFEEDLNKLNMLKYQINRSSSEISNLNIRRDLIIEAGKELNSNVSNIDLQQLEIIYQQAAKYISTIQKTFEELVQYHNQMIVEKIKFITKELPALEDSILEKNRQLTKLLLNEKTLSLEISKSDSFVDLEAIIGELNDKYRKKGEYETIIQQLNEIDKTIEDLRIKLNEIDSSLFSDDFEQRVKNQINKFNRYFASVSNKLYGEQYALRYDKIVNAKNQRLYVFNTFNTNLSSGKKQGEIVCFDIAYTLFTDDENMPCLHFLLNDKKELMHDNQLLRISEFVSDCNIQFVASILKDKLPKELNKEEYFILKLSPLDKLFRVEKYRELE